MYTFIILVVLTWAQIFLHPGAFVKHYAYISIDIIVIIVDQQN